MLLVRRFEERAGQMYGMQKIRGFCHLYIGQEAVAAGSISAIKESDVVITAYRDHGMAITKGIDPKAAMAELFGKSTGCSKGKGGSMHFFSKEHKFYGGHGIVGGQIPLGAGIALAEKYNNSGNICLCFMGDGAVRQGSFHETFNMAMTWKLPVVFICENNHYAMGTSVERTSNVTEIYKLGLGYNMPSKEVDGMRPETVYDAVYEAAENARSGKGPAFLEVLTYRYRGHSMSDPARYRSKEEVEEYKHKDPIDYILSVIKEKKYATDAEIEVINEKIKNRVDEAVKFAEDSPFPEPGEIYHDNYVQADYPYIMD